MIDDAAVQDRETPDEPTALDKPLNRTQAMGFGLAPRNFDEAWRMADLFGKSELVPKGYHGKTADILVAMAYGAEIGLPPMASLSSIAVINGRPGLYGDGFLAVIQSTRAYAKHEEYYRLASGEIVKSLQQADYAKEETTAVARFWRTGVAEAFVGEFSVGDAKRAKLWGKEGPWSTYPSRMLKFRARGFAARDAFAAELRGIKTAEELTDMPRDEPYIESAPIIKPVRRSEKAAAAVTTSNLESAGDQAREAGVTTEPEDPHAETPAKPGPAPTPQVMKGLRITDTKFIPGNEGRPPAYEIHANKGEAGEVGIDQVFVTRDEQLYKLAVSCEDAQTRFDVLWYEAKTETTKKVVKVLTGLTAAD